MGDKKFRLVTRSDFDGLACAALLKELDMIEDVKFVHPKDMQDGTILISDNDIITNLPYVKGAHLAFDHHLSQATRLDDAPDNHIPDNHIIDPGAPSAARLVYDYYGGKEAFPRVYGDMIEAVDKSDSARFSRDEVMEPSGWVLLNYLIDARTGLGRFKNFRISNYQLMLQLIDFCRGHTVDEILKLPDVKERADLYMNQQDSFKSQIENCTKVHGSLAVLDLRREDVIFAGNRFMIYALFPKTNISIHVIWGLNRLNTVFACGKSILNRTSEINVGQLMLEYGGGGHFNVGTCQVDNDVSDQILDELISRIKADG